MIITWVTTVLSIGIGFFLGRISDKSKTLVQAVKDETKVVDRVKAGPIRKKKKRTKLEEAELKAWRETA
ncbi:MAG TPA: hypothetical protein ENI23_13980 [bacterium]|nr:hypothetical protein [bacterium]